MLHLPALPGSPQAQHSLQQIESMLLEEASLLVETGFDACIVENFGDTPFFGERVAPITIASMTRLIASLRRAQPGLLTGVNVLRNDARAALAVATACEASFIRVNVHVGTTATDQGVLEGRAAQTMRLRRELQANVQVWADVHVKHGRSLTHEHIEQEALDCVHRGGADAIIVSGHGTGQEASLAELQRVRDLHLGVPVYVGSGVRRDNVQGYLAVANGVIVGTDLKEGGVTGARLDVARARELVAQTGRAAQS
jgi:membrane complex biogenesis BtpA family protein